MRLATLLLATALGTATLLGATPPAQAQNEQFVPVLVYRTGAYAPNGIPWANGFVDYLNLINERDGGVNGVKLTFEECETGYATDRGVECYERLKAKGPTGAAFFNPLSTGITFAMMEKAPVDKIPVVTMGYGRTEAVDGRWIPWTFPLLGTYWSAADIIMQHITKELGGADKLKGKKIALVYHDSPFGREPIPVFQEHARRSGFDFTAMPVTHPGVEQKSTWLQVRQQRPDYVALWGWGVMNLTAFKEAAAVNFPREKIIGVWWSGAEPDVVPSMPQSQGVKALAMHGTGQDYGVIKDILKHVYDKNKGAGKREEVGQVLYMRGMINAMLSIEGMRTAQEKYGKKPLTGEEMRWGLENIKIDEAGLTRLGAVGLLRPLTISCTDHEGGGVAYVQQWDGTAWKKISDWYSADQKMLRPLIEAAANKYGEDKKLSRRTDCGS